MKRSHIKRRLTKNFLAGFAIALGLIGGGLLAVAVTGTFNTFTSGGVMKAADINANFASLKAAIEGIPTQQSMRLIYEYDVPATTGSIVVSGLDGDSDVEYMIVTKFAGATAGGGDFQIELNGDSTLCNYKVQVITAYETGSVGSYIGCPGSGGGLSINGTGGTALTAGTIFVTNLYLFAKTGSRRVGLYEPGKTLSTSESIVYSGMIWWENTTSNITTMRFFYTNGNGIGAGSRIEIWAKR